MDSENVISKNINLAITFIETNDIEMDFESVKDETVRQELQKLLREFKDEPNLDARTESFDEVRSIIN